MRVTDYLRNSRNSKTRNDGNPPPGQKPVQWPFRKAQPVNLANPASGSNGTNEGRTEQLGWLRQNNGNNQKRVFLPMVSNAAQPTTYRNEYPNPANRSGYASPTSMTEAEWRARRQAWQRYYGTTGMTEQERILRQNAAELGYQYTPYAGYIPVKMPNAGEKKSKYDYRLAAPTSSSGYSSGGGGYGYYDYGGGGGGGGGGGYSSSFYNDLMTWKIK